MRGCYNTRRRVGSCEFTFTQVLQTEINKPLTVELFVENGKVPGWLGRLTLGGAGFLALWALMAVVGKRREV